MKKLIQSVATAVRRCVHGLVSWKVGLVINTIAWALDYIAPLSPLHVYALLALVFWMGAKFRDLTANAAGQGRREALYPEPDVSAFDSEEPDDREAASD